MKTDELANKMMDKLNGALTEREAVEFDVYLANDADAKEELDFFQEAWTALDNIETPEASEKLTDNFYEKLDNELKAEQYSVSRNWQQFKTRYLNRLVLSRAAVVLLLLSAGLYFGGKTGFNPLNANNATAGTGSQTDLYAKASLNQHASERLEEMYSVAATADEKRVISELMQSLEQDPNINVRLMAVEELTPYVGNNKVRQKLANHVKKEPSPLVQAEMLNAIMAKADVAESISTMEGLLRDKNLNLFVKEKIQKDLPVLRASFTN